MRSTGMISACCTLFCTVFLLHCDNSNPASPSPQSQDHIGVWKGLSIYTNPGANNPDSTGIEMTVGANDSYTLARHIVTHSSSEMAIYDSAWERGTWSRNDSLLTLNPAEGKYYDAPAAMWVNQSNLIPHDLSIEITGTTWTFKMPDWKNGDTITYSATKQ